MSLEKYFILALMIQLIIPCFVLVQMFIRRITAVRNGELSPYYFKQYQAEGVNVPKTVILSSRHFSNLFEMPILYFVLSLFILIKIEVDIIHVILAWSFVGLRIIHTIIHLNSNKLVRRLVVFAMSSVVLIIMWGYILTQILS